MTLYGVIFVALGLALAIAMARRELRLGGDYLAPIALYAWHTAMVVAYWLFSQYSEVDATAYFQTGAYYALDGVGTDLIMWLTGALRWLMPSASMLDIFILYGLTGYVGLILFLRTASDLTGAAYPAVKRWVYLFAFLPGLSFWTAAIGKDAPMFLGIQMVIWGLCRPTHRIAAIAGGLAIAFAIRPHIAIVIGIAGCAAVIFARGANMRLRVGAALAAVAIAIAAVPFAAQYLNIQSFDSETLQSYVFAREHDLEIGGSAVDLSGYPFPIKLFTYLFRPTLIEAHSATEFAAALENTAEFGIFLLLLANIATVWRLLRRQPVSMFCAIFFLAGAGASALMTANLGMAMRQKEQFMPCLFLLLSVGLAVRAQAGWRRRAAEAPIRPLAEPCTRRRPPMTPATALPANDLTSRESHFAFGENWRSFVDQSHPDALADAKQGLSRLLTPEDIAGRSFLDVGCGSGLSMLAATELGAGEVEGFDIDPDSVTAARALFARAGRPCHVSVGSVFDPPVRRAYDIVHSWGVLHHTGDMWRAIEQAICLVKPQGLFVVALYRRTLACPAWRLEKRVYSRSPGWTQAAIAALYKTAFRAKLLLTGHSPSAFVGGYHGKRGMSWPHDVHDWLGGYPYESVKPETLARFMTGHGFVPVRSVVTPGGVGLFGSGCDEFVWRRIDA